MRRLAVGLAAAAVVLTSAPSVAVAEDLCGWFAMAGAYSTRTAARREARRLDLEYYDLDESDSESAGEGFWVVASGPFETRRAARREVRRLYFEEDVEDAYAKNICFYLDD